MQEKTKIVIQHKLISEGELSGLKPGEVAVERDGDRLFYCTLRDETPVVLEYKKSNWPIWLSLGSFGVSAAALALSLIVLFNL
jgi:hypothetical protein